MSPHKLMGSQYCLSLLKMPLSPRLNVPKHCFTLYVCINSVEKVCIDGDGVYYYTMHSVIVISTLVVPKRY